MMLAPKKNETPFAYWISFWPTAPMFGVKWRFEGMMPPFFQPATTMGEVARAAAAEAAEAMEKTIGAGADAMMGAAAIAVEEITAPAKAAGPARAANEAAAEETVVEAVAETTEAAAGLTEAAAEAAPAVAVPAVLFDRRPDEVDDLKQIRGVGPKLETMLNDMGIYRLDQIAGFSPENLAWVDANLTAFKGRPLRDDWVAQARALLSASRQLI